MSLDTMSGWGTNVQAFAVAIIRANMDVKLNPRAVALLAMDVADEIEKGRAARVGKPVASWGTGS